LTPLLILDLDLSKQCLQQNRTMWLVVPSTKNSYFDPFIGIRVEIFSSCSLGSTVHLPANRHSVNLPISEGTMPGIEPKRSPFFIFPGTGIQLNNPFV
jgi:hypothetical protein